MGSPRTPRPHSFCLWQAVLDLEVRMEGDDGGEVLLPPEEWRLLVTFAKREEEAQEQAQRDRVKRSLERYDEEQAEEEPQPKQSRRAKVWAEKFPPPIIPGQKCTKCKGGLEVHKGTACPKVPPPRAERDAQPVDADDYNGRPKRDGGFAQASLDDLSREVEAPADAVKP